MKITSNELLQNDVIRAGLRSAWDDSSPGVTGGHEEGGFVLLRPNGEILIERWPIGKQNRITVPPHPDCRIGKYEILASFHKHPNTSSTFLQEPSVTDRRAVRDDPNLKGRLYVGEFVIAADVLYLIQTDGDVVVMGSRRTLLKET